MRNKSLAIFTAVFFFCITIGLSACATGGGLTLEKVKVPLTINGVPVNAWNPTEQGFYSVTDHVVTHFSFKSKLPEKEAKLMDGMKVLEWHIGYFTLHPNTPEAKVDQFLCFYLGDKEPAWMACFDYHSLGEDRDGKKGLAWTIYYELSELKHFMPIAPPADKTKEI